MDNASSLECLKLDSQSKVLDKDSDGKDLFSSAMVSLSCDTPIIYSKVEEAKTKPESTKLSDLTEEELPTYFYLFDGPPSPTGSKSDESKSETGESEDEGSFIGECKFCLKVNKHPTQQCSYKYKVPKDAIVGESCVVACLVCGCLFRNSRCADCGTSLGRAFLKDCLICGKEGEHLEFECPKRDANSGFTYDPYTGSFSIEIRPLKQ